MSTPYDGAPSTQAPPVPIFVGLDLSLTCTGVAIIHGDRVSVRRAGLDVVVIPPSTVMSGVGR